MFKKLFFLSILMNAQQLFAQKTPTSITFKGVDSFLLNTSKLFYLKNIKEDNSLIKIGDSDKKSDISFYQYRKNNSNFYYIDSFEFLNLGCFFIGDSVLSAISMNKLYRVTDFINVGKKVEEDKNILIKIISERLNRNSEFVKVKPSKNKIDYQYFWTKDNYKVALSIKLENRRSDFVFMELTFIDRNLMPL
jgi:hypothetical protein